MSIFANNIEAMGFDKSGWVIVETSADGNTTYMGKPMTPDAKPDEPVWSIKRIVTNEKGGIKTIETRIEHRVKWIDKENYSYDKHF